MGDDSGADLASSPQFVQTARTGSGFGQEVLEQPVDLRTIAATGERAAWSSHGGTTIIFSTMSSEHALEEEGGVIFVAFKLLKKSMAGVSPDGRGRAKTF